MKNFILCLSLFLAYAVTSAAQSVFLNIDKNVSYTQHFYYKDFLQGSVRFDDGTSSGGLLNILLADSMLCFIDENGNPQLLNNDNAVVSVTIGGDYFIRLFGHYIQVKNTDGNVLYGVEQYIEVEGEKRYGAFGRAEDNSNTLVKKLDVREAQDHTLTPKPERVVPNDVPYKVHQNIYLIKGKKAYPPSEKNFLRFFPKKSADISRYLETDKVDFSNPEQTLALFNYLVNN
jgi:hypothetical protein